MCLFTSARTVAIVFTRSAGSEAMYCAGVLTFDGGFMDSSSSQTKCITRCGRTFMLRNGLKQSSRADVSHQLHIGFKKIIRRQLLAIDPAHVAEDAVLDLTLELVDAIEIKCQRRAVGV